MVTYIEIETGLSINSPVNADKTTARGMRRALGAMLRQSSPGQPRFGVLGAGALAVTGRADMKYGVGAGYAVCGRTGQGAYIVGIPSAIVVDTDPADSANPRIDRIYIVQPDPELSDSGKARVGVAVGTPAGSPALPALPAGALELARKQIGANASSTNAGAAFTNVAQATGALIDGSTLGQVLMYVASKQAAREALGIYVRSAALNSSNDVNDIRFWG